MATFNPRYGWQWTDGERESRKVGVWKVQRHLEKLAEQVRRINSLLPEFAEPAERAFGAVAGGLGKLRELNITNRGPKYQAVSPAEADEMLAAAPDVFRLWAAFASAPEFVHAVRESNKAVRRANVEGRQRRMEYFALMNKLAERMRPVYEMLDRGERGAALEYAARNGLLGSGPYEETRPEGGTP